MNILCIDPATDPRWDRLVTEMSGSLFHSPPWVRVLNECYGFDTQALILVDGDGEPIGGVPLCKLSDLLGSRIVALPFSDYCDPLVATKRDWELLFGELRARGFPVSFRCLNCKIPMSDERLTMVKKARWHAVDLEDDPEGMWRNISDSTRRAIRKARREGVELRTMENRALVNEFHQLHLTVRKYKYRLLAQPCSFFEAIRRQFKEVDGWFPLAASHQGRTIAVTLFLRWKDTLYYKFNASRFEALHLRPNDFLLWEGI
ncbi:MAG: GNAT family N-acetyltransferase, partial [Deltaproteobacteria bacterium]|nr:GNAT family N-acetyltransferase [Deltaproteobacteria bacterium]